MNVVVLKHFESEVEARVVESFLRAQGFDVKLLDTYSPTTHRLTPNKQGQHGMRLLVREDEVAKIRELLEDRVRAAHLQLVEEEHGAVPRTAWARIAARVRNFFS